MSTTKQQVEQRGIAGGINIGLPQWLIARTQWSGCLNMRCRQGNVVMVTRKTVVSFLGF